ncbi:MAG: hypothetical protein MUE97_05865 [Phycisphaerales bacterium]|nr:hypothetical protein [Phycisphaerales bacterium]
MLKTLLLILHRPIDRLAAMLGYRRDWWVVFLAQLPISWRESRRVSLRTYKYFEEHMEEFLRTEPGLPTSPRDRRLLAERHLRLRHIETLVAPEFEIGLTSDVPPQYPYSYGHDRLILRYRVTPSPGELSVEWHGVVREWSVDSDVVKSQTFPAGLIEDVRATWNSIRSGRLIRVMIHQVMASDGYDYERGVPTETHTIFLPHDQVHLWRNHWPGDDRYVVEIVSQQWSKPPTKHTIRPFADAVIHSHRVYRESQLAKGMAF